MCTAETDRRQFLTAFGLAAAGCIVGRPAMADFSREARRSLSFWNTHTGERVSAVYWADGDYVPEALASIDRVLRDHRTGEVTRIDRHLLDVLHALRADLGTTAPFHVISCYRGQRLGHVVAVGPV